jgi:pSer/pThr/pTyr-binding forkhead associated (FHA) protein
MFDLFKQNDSVSPQDVKTLRHRLLQFVKAQLQRFEGGEGNSIKGMQLFVAPAEEEKGLYEGALYFDEQDRFKEEEIQKIADDYSIDLPANWTLEIAFADELPKECIKAKDVKAGLHIATRKQPGLTQLTTAYVKVLGGEAEEPKYTLTANIKKFCIGRERRSQTADGFLRVNDIAFPTDKHPSNKFVSRQHAHIEWNKETGNFFLYADEGGVPPRNKIKVRVADGSLIKLQSTQIGHQLQEGDQVVLGESALLQFTYLDE